MILFILAEKLDFLFFFCLKHDCVFSGRLDFCGLVRKSPLFGFWGNSIFAIFAGNLMFVVLLEKLDILFFFAGKSILAILAGNLIFVILTRKLNFVVLVENPGYDGQKWEESNE